MKLKHYLFAAFMLLGLASCSEADDTVEEYADWQVKNETYFEQQFQHHVPGTATSFALKKVSLPDTLSLSKVAHTDCILVDVLASGVETNESPLYTDQVDVSYIGRLIPSPSYPDGYVFDATYTGAFDPVVSASTTFSVNGVIEGFATALQHMHRGDHWRITIPYQLGYGASAQNAIPAYSTLIFDIRLKDFGAEE